MSKRNKFSPGRGRRPGSTAGETSPAARRHDAPGAARRRAPEPELAPGGAYWLYGRHAVKAALLNPRRRIQRLLQAEGMSPEGREIGALSARGSHSGGQLSMEPVGHAALTELLPDGAVHQGIAALVLPLPPIHIEEICDRAAMPW